MGQAAERGRRERERREGWGWKEARSSCKGQRRDSEQSQHGEGREAQKRGVRKGGKVKEEGEGAIEGV